MDWHDFPSLDPTSTTVNFKRYVFADVQALEEWTSTVQANRIVRRIECDFDSKFIDDDDDDDDDSDDDSDVDHDDFNYTPLVDLIRKYSQLRELILNDLTDEQFFDISRFLSAAAENTTLESLRISYSPTFATESLGRFQSHSKLKTIDLDMGAFHNDPSKIETLRQVIETCPLLENVILQKGQFTSENWMPISAALLKVQPELTLEFTNCTFDEDATVILQELLHTSSASIHFVVTYTEFPPLESSSWLARLLGPSVIAFSFYCFNSFTTIRDLKEVMKRLRNVEATRNIKEVHFSIHDRAGDSGDAYQAIFDGIPELLFVNEFTMRYDFHSIFLLDQAGPLLAMKQKFLDVLPQNASIQKLNLQLFENNRDIMNWTDAEKQRLEYMQLRNRSISHWITMPHSIPHSLWPYVFPTVPNSRAGSYLIYQCMRGLLECLPDTASEGSGRRSKRKVELLY